MQKGRKIAFYTLGCKLNFSETSAIAHNLEEQGYEKVKFSDQADYYVINTCSVTQNADKECRSVIRKALKSSPGAKIIVTGCYAQLKPHEIADIEGVNLVLGASEKFNIGKYLNTLTFDKGNHIYSCEIEEVNEFHSSYSLYDRTRTFLKVQDGCDYNCSFCTIPLARGKSRSDTIENVVKNAEKITAEGTKEIVLTGVNIGDFGKGFHGGRKQNESFLNLIKALDKVEGIKRYRISSIEPNLLNNDIIEFVADSEKFMPHFHIPLQSGSPEILKKMRRRYVRDLYQDRVQKIKQLMPHCCIGVDVIVGFPGETEKHFLETYHFLNELDISYLHVFTYSERENTVATDMGGAVSSKQRKERSKMLRILSGKKRRQFYSEHIHTARPVLFEAKNDNGLMAGFTDNYIKTLVPYDEGLVNQLVDVSLSEINQQGNMTGELSGELIS